MRHLAAFGSLDEQCIIELKDAIAGLIERLERAEEKLATVDW